MRSAVNVFPSVLLLLVIASSLALSQHSFYENGEKSRPEVLNYASPTRSILDLTGEWNVSSDDGKTFGKVRVPSAYTGAGKLIFTRRITLSAADLDNKAYKFVAYGIDYESEIYINEIFIGKHEGGYTSFSFPVPDNALQVGSDNFIRIVVRTDLDARSTLPVRQQIWGWKNYGGITRDIFLVGLPRVWVDDAVVTTAGIEARGVRLAIDAVLSAREVTTPPANGYLLSAEVTDKASGQVVGKSASVAVTPEANKDASVRLEVTASNVRFWSPDAPELYTVHLSLHALNGRVSTPVDEYQLVTGIRTLAKDHRGILLNGAPLVLRGVAWMEDSPLHGSAMSYEEMERDIALIKNLGANAVRFAFHPPHPFLLQLCDQYGLLALEEIPLDGVPAEILAGENFRALAEHSLREMIRRDRNHPSIIAWGLGDGFESADPAVKPVIIQLNGAAKALDNRLTYYVSRSQQDLDNSAIVDIAAIDLDQPDVRQFTAMVKSWRDAHAPQPVLIAGYGKAAEPGNRNGYADPMSQESQARYLMLRYDALKELNIAGGIVWAFSDWRTARPLMTIHAADPFISTYGIVELNREKKVAYDVVRSLFLGEKVSALPVGTASSSSPVSYVLIGLAVLIFFFWLLNGNRRFRESVNRAFLRPYNFYADVRDQRILSNLHTVALAVIVAVTVGVVFSSVLYHYRHDAVLDFLITHFVTSDSAKAFLIRLVWSPLHCVGYVAGFALAFMTAVLLLILLGSLFVRPHVSFFHAFSVAVWSALPLVLFIPVGMILFRVMESSAYVIPVLVLIALVLIWVFFRTLKGVSIIYDAAPLKVYAIVLVLVAAVLAAAFTYYDHTYATSAYMHYLLTTIVPAVS